MQIIFLYGTKCLRLPQNVYKFLVWHKKFGPAQNILEPVKGQGIIVLNYVLTFVEMVRTFLMCKNMYKQFSSFRHPGGYFWHQCFIIFHVLKHFWNQTKTSLRNSIKNEHWIGSFLYVRGVKVNIFWEDHKNWQIFVAFSKYLNFKYIRAILFIVNANSSCFTIKNLERLACIKRIFFKIFKILKTQSKYPVLH